MSGEKPDACPNPECGDGEVEFYRPMQVAAGRREGCWCRRCNVHGPIGKDRASAVRLWNRLPRAAGRGDLM